MSDVNAIYNAILDNKVVSEYEPFISYLLEKEILVLKDIPCKKIPSILDAYNYPRPINFAWIEVTNICNLKCIHCYNEKATLSKKYLSLDDFKYIVDELCDFGIKKVQLIGGEPFIMNNRTLFQMLDYLSPRVESFELFINGTLNTKEDLLYIKYNYPNAHIATSLHSFIKEEHERVTQVEGSYDMTIANIRNAKEIQIPIRYVGALMGCIKVGQELEFGPPSRRDFIRLSGNANLKLYNDDLLKERIITKKRFEIDNLKEWLDVVYNENCFSTHLYIGCDMEVYPCPMERRISHGNLKTNKIKNLLKQNILNFSKDNINVCRDCEYRYFCIDCRPDSITGNIYEKPWYCTYDPYSGQWDTFEKFKEKLFSNYNNGQSY
jgi:radical SAM protein with 4Fe4S-binding SPASM domain